MESCQALAEMKTFLAIVLLFGIIHRPAVHMYWVKDDYLSSPIFSKLMIRDRFNFIQRFLHFNNNEDPQYDKDDENQDRLHKIRPLLDIIQRRCRTIYCPGQNLSVDESLVLFKGRLKFKQYIKTKRARFGIKVYECEVVVELLQEELE